MTRKTKNKYNHYTEDFQREAARRADDPDTSATEVARELGDSPRPDLQLTNSGNSIFIS